MSSSKQKLQRSFSTPSSSSSNSVLDCDLKLRGKSVGLTPELKYSKSLQEDSPVTGEGEFWVVKVLICFSMFFLEIFLVNICLLISLVNVTLADLLFPWDSNRSELLTISYNIIIGLAFPREVGSKLLLLVLVDQSNDRINPEIHQPCTQSSQSTNIYF